MEEPVRQSLGAQRGEMPEEELARAKELAAIMANMGQGTSTETEPVERERRQGEVLVKETKQVAPEKEHEWTKEI